MLGDFPSINVKMSASDIEDPREKRTKNVRRAKIVTQGPRMEPTTPDVLQIATSVAIVVMESSIMAMERHAMMAGS